MNLEQRRIVREELWRSIVWIGLGMVGWPVLVTETSWLGQNLLTVFGLPVVTWAVLTAGMIGIRTLTSSELQLSTPRLPVFVLEAVVLGSICWIYLVVVESYGSLLVTVSGVAVGVATVVWYWYTRVFDSSADPTG